MIPSIFYRKMEKWNCRGVILMYHRVIDLKADPWQLAVSPKNFREQLAVIQKYGRTVTMRELSQKAGHFSFGKPDIAITFDDGYADNFFNARQILREKSVPATFFVVSGTLGARRGFWWDELAEIVFHSTALPGHFALTILGKDYDWGVLSAISCEDLRYESGLPENGQVLSRGRLYYALWEIIRGLSDSQKREIFDRLTQWSGILLSEGINHLPMTADQVRVLADCKDFEIGAHTVSHPQLSRLSRQDQEREIIDSKRDLEAITGKAVTSFSYPFGDYIKETVEMVREAGFHMACTVRPGVLRRGSDRYQCPRFMVMDWAKDEFETNLVQWLKERNLVRQRQEFE